MNVNLSPSDMESLAEDGYTPVSMLRSWADYHEDPNVVLDKRTIEAYKTALGSDAISQCGPYWFFLLYARRGAGHLHSTPEEISDFLKALMKASVDNPALVFADEGGEGNVLWRSLAAHREVKRRGVKTADIIHLLDKVEQLADIEYVYHSRRGGKRVLDDAQIAFFRQNNVPLAVARHLVESQTPDNKIVTLCRPVSELGNPIHLQDRLIKNIRKLQRIGVAVDSLDLETFAFMPHLSGREVSNKLGKMSSEARLEHLKVCGQACKRIAEQSALCGIERGKWSGVQDILLARSTMDREFIDAILELEDVQLSVALVMAEDRYSEYDSKSGRQLPVSKKWFLNNAKAMV